MTSLKGLSILVADDELELRDIMMESLAYSGAAVVGVANGAEAWAELNKRSFDVVLSDIRMPGGDGVELVKRISSELQVKPILFLITGFSDLSLQEAQKYGVIEIFNKPFSMKNIIQIVADSAAKKHEAA